MSRGIFPGSRKPALRANLNASESRKHFARLSTLIFVPLFAEMSLQSNVIRANASGFENYRATSIYRYLTCVWHRRVLMELERETGNCILREERIRGLIGNIAASLCNS